MKTRKLGPLTVAEIGLGCMSLSHAYGAPPAPADAAKLLLHALEHGTTHFDTASLYGFGANEDLVGATLKPHRSKITLASKCGMTGVDGKRVIDGRPETLKRTCEESLRRLQTEFIDLYYLHRWDRAVPIEDSIGALADLVREGKIGLIGLSEVSAGTLLKAHAVHPISALQTEYSLWTRNAEVAVLETTRQIGAAFVAFSPLARGFLANGVRDPAELVEKDIRRGMPRFQTPHFSRNFDLLETYLGIACDAEVSPAQLALAWLLQRADHILPIPGTTSTTHLDDNNGASGIFLPAGIVARLEALINAHTVSGPRYPAATQTEIDTEELV